MKWSYGNFKLAGINWTTLELGTEGKKKSLEITDDLDLKQRVFFQNVF